MKKKDNTWLWVAVLGVGGYLVLRHNQAQALALTQIPLQPVNNLPAGPVALLPPASNLSQSYAPVSVQPVPVPLALQPAPPPVMPVLPAPTVTITDNGPVYTTPVINDAGNYSVVVSDTPINASDNLLEQQMYQQYQNSITQQNGWLSGPGDCH